jgi:antitoxin FitA
MARLTIGRLDDQSKERIRVRAAANGRSMADEAQFLIAWALDHIEADGVGLGTSIRRRFAPLGDFRLERPPRGRVRTPPRFK